MKLQLRHCKEPPRANLTCHTLEIPYLEQRKLLTPDYYSYSWEEDKNPKYLGFLPKNHKHGWEKYWVYTGTLPTSIKLQHSFRLFYQREVT